jgi:hypothetical protein
MNRQKYNLFLDDDPRRIPNKLGWVNLPSVSWTIVRNYDEFVKTITERGLPEICSFDHDLGDTAYQEFFRANATDKRICYENIREKTGYDCAVWLVNYCIDKGAPLPVYYIHSLNPMGSINIRFILDSAKERMK